MEIIKKFKENGYFTAELYHLLAKKRLLDSSTDICPSQYVDEMKMSTQQRLQNLNNMEIDNIVSLDNKPKKVILSFTPRLLVFQNFKPNEKVITKFSVKNISKAPTFINMVFKESSYFSIKTCGGQLLSRLAPGISVSFAITFLPVQYEDYIHRVTFFTDVDQYVLPIIAFGPRPIFNIPDRILLPKTPLKVETHFLMNIKNTSVVPAGLTLNTKSPFSVYPKSAYLYPNENIDIKIKFKTMYLGEVQGLLYASLETGENFRVQLTGCTHTESIELEKEIVRFFDTYNTMVRQQTFKIINKSDHVLTYMCMKNESVYYDFKEKIKLATTFYNTKTAESAKNEKLVYYDVLSSEEHERVYSRIFFDEIQALVADESLTYQNTHFSVTPIKGNLWPNKPTELTITFCPQSIGEFHTTIYLDIDGVYNRVPLELVGISIPPCIHLNIETLDMDRVYINKLYNYEIVAINKGHINGIIVYKEVPTLFGSTITCSPAMHCLTPGEKQIFVISFCNSNQGPFFEEINFWIRDTDVILKLYLKGEVVYPSLRFSVPCLDFGTVSIGVPESLELDVINESIVSIVGSVKISSDGPEISSITLVDYAVAEKPKPQVPQWPREFNIEPCKVDIKPESRITLKVTLVANLIRANQTSLELELEKSDSPPIVLPVIFNALVPNITPAPDIKMRACFLDFPYHIEIAVTSDNLKGYFTLEEPKETTLEVELAIDEGYIEPDSTLIIPVTIKTDILGMQEYVMRMNLFGMSKPIEICNITGCGVRPIVTCNPMALHWGQVKLLSTTQKCLTLCNDSPVVVNYKASLLNKDGRWQITPAEGHVDPESETDLILSLYLVDVNTYTNKAVLQLEKVKDILVPLSATGVGTSILVGELRDSISLGRHFTKIPLNCKVMMENRGTKMHVLEWSEHYKAPKMKQPTSGFFNLEPRSFKMAAGEKLELLITGLSYKVTTVKEMWYLVGSVEGINKKELLLECQITAEFVDPKIEVSSSIIEFQYDYGPYSEYYKLTDIVTIKNVSKLPLDMEISIKPPFAIIQRSDTYLVTPEEEYLCGCIQYRESDLNLQRLMKSLGPHESSVFIDCLTLKPVEPLRQGSLNFFRDINKLKLAFNLTHMVEECLEDRDVMKLQILFDTTKHTNLKSKVYCDVLRIKFKGHKNKDAIKVIGQINYPNILVLTPRVDFQCIQNGSVESKTIKLQNTTPLLVCYNFQWKKCSITDTPLPEYYKKGYTNVCTDLKSSKSSVLEEVPTAKFEQIQNLDNNSVKDEITEQTQAANQHFVGKACDSDIDIFADFELLKKDIMNIVTPMIDSTYYNQFEWIHKFQRKTEVKKTDINGMFKLIPHRSLLKKGEIQYLHLMFQPKPNINVRAVLECEVLGGPSETIQVTGRSSELRYKLNAEKVNFKIRSFHENAIEELVITNTTQLPFEYKTYLTELKSKSVLEAIILELVPPEKQLEEEEVRVQIVVHPGILGYFHKTFLLEIGHLPHIPIEVFGWGVIPQVYLTLQKSKGIADLEPEIGYKALPTLTNEYLIAIDEIFSKNKTEHMNSPLMEKCFEDLYFQKEWHICSPWDGYPSKMDIDLAIERLLVIQHVMNRPDVLNAYTTNSKTGPIQGFHSEPYIIDYGVVITGSTVQCVADIINYGPIATKLYFARGTNVPPWLSMKLCGKLNPGETGKLEVTFTPTSEDFTELEQNVETSFNIEVPYGVSIPIQIKALCAVPYLVSSVKSIDFGSVRCGDKIVCSIPIKNLGRPTCIWYVTLRLKCPGPQPMAVLDNSGKYEPGDGGMLSIAFKPTMEMVYEALLIFRFHMNPNRMTIPVTGNGILPRVHVIGPNVNFSPTLPWAEISYIYFGLTNPCPFPIELIIAHSDDKWQIEEEIYQLLFKYYNKPAEMLVPAIRPGAGLPKEVIDFYIMFNERVRKIKEETALGSGKTTTKTSASTKKTKPPPKSAKAPGITKESDSRSSPIKYRTEAEIIADEMKYQKEREVDPLKSSLKVFDKDKIDINPEKSKKGLLVFAHGSPCEEIQGQEIACSIGKVLNLPVINVDHCIVHALLRAKENAQIEMLLNAIDENYEAAKKAMITADDTPDEHEEDEFDETEDEFDVLLRKVMVLANSRNSATPRSKANDKKKLKKSNPSLTSHAAETLFGTTTLFQMELVEELLTDYFKSSIFHRGFVVESLTSVILKSPPLVLTTGLKCKRSIWNVHLVLCHADFAKWVHAYEEAHKETDLLSEPVASRVFDETEIQEIVKSLEELDDEEYEDAPAEFKAIYVIYGLEHRRNKHLENKHFQKSTAVSSATVKEKGKESASKSATTIDGGDAKKKVKKDEYRGKPSSEYAAMCAKYTEYSKTTYESLTNIATNWVFEECDLGSPLYAINGQIAGAVLKKNKKKSEIQLQVSDVNLGDRGFPLSLVMSPCLSYKNAVMNMFASCPVVREALKDDEEIDVLKNPMEIREYTVLMPKVFPTINYEEPLQWRYLKEEPLKKCECNQLTDLNLLDDSTQDNVLNILSKWHCTCGTKMISTQTSTTEVPSTVEKMIGDDVCDDLSPLPLHIVESLGIPGKRIVLQPGDLVRCKYSFSPQDEGNYSVKRFVEVSGWPDSRIDINVNGICDLPRLDSRPKKMFDDFARRTIEDHVYKLTYLDDKKVFEFGPIFVGLNRIYEEEYTINLKNSSLITADVVVEFLEETSVFQIDKTFIRLEPGCRDKLKISAAPAEEEVHTSVLLFCVKDNPEIVAVNISCSGVKPIVEILPQTKHIEYGRLLLYRREDDRFIVKNDSILSVMWKIRNAEEFVEDFIISKTSGIVPRHDNEVVQVTYIACRVGVINNKALVIDIYDAEGRGEPMIIDSLYLSAECYDVTVDCAYENAAENFLNYGNVKVNSIVYREMYLLNRGKYDIYFKLKKVKNFPEPSLLKSFQATPETGIVPSSLKLTCIEFECTPTTSMNLVNVPVYTCSLLDGSRDQVVVAKFPVCVTIASFYNTFTLFPLGELNFHIIAVGTAVIREVILNNTSKCPVTYDIILPKMYQIDPNAPPPSAKGKDNKIRNPPLKCGNFLIMNEDNLLAPGTSRTIQIQFSATASRKFEETINFVISDTCPAEAHGVPLRLVGTGAMPTLDVWNIETTFREHLIVKNLSEYKVPESSPHCVFVEDSVTLHFFCVTVNTRFVGSIDLYNNGLVASALTMKLHFQTNTNSDIFSLDKYNSHIEPLMHKNLGIIFTPKALMEYRAVLEIKLKLLDNQEQSFKICLIGEGVIPRIKMISPQIKQQRHASLQLPVTCLGAVSFNSISFKNISSIKCIVMIEIIRTSNERRPIFWLTADAENEHMVIDNKDSTAYKFNRDDELNVSLKMILNPEVTAKIHINYSPIRKGRSRCEVRLTIVENPYEYFIVTCEGEAFMEDVILMGLTMLPIDTDRPSAEGIGGSTHASAETNVKRSKVSVESKKSVKLTSGDLKKRSASSINTGSSQPPVLRYELDFGGCELCSIQRRTVTMVNNSEKVYRFYWGLVEDVVLKPSMGYISPGEEKDLEVMFYSPKPVVVEKESLTCTLLAVSDDTLTLDMKGATWDNRQLVTVFQHDMDICLNQRDDVIIEEQVIPAPESFLGSITLMVIYSVITEYTKYSSTLPEEKILRDTFIYQTRTFSFNVENVGNVPMKIEWSFIIDDEYPSRADKQNSCRMEAVVEDEALHKTSIDDSFKSFVEPSSVQHGNEKSNVTLFSESADRQSVDTWFEVDLPFRIEPVRACLKPREKTVFNVTFSPLDAFDFNVKLKSSIDNLDPYDQNISCKLTARSLIPYVHLNIEESDYLTSGRRKVTGVALPPHMTVLEFNVLGSGCYKKTFNVVNPTSEPYEFIFEMIQSDKPELIPVHCNMLKGFVEGGTSTEVTFTFSPSAPGLYESQWKFMIPVYDLVMNMLVVGSVREPDVVFVPTILVIRNSLVGFTTIHDVILKNNESEPLKFEFKGNSLCNESGKTPVVVEPDQGTLRPRSETPIKMIYTPIDDGPLSFKIFCSITHLTKYLTLCVNALSYLIKPKVTYFIIGNEHILNKDADTNIYLDQTASTYERTIPFVIKNDGSATFFYEWTYNSSAVKKYLQVYVEPRKGHVAPGNEVNCTLHFNLKKIPVQAFPVNLLISDGPEYKIFLYAEIEKPMYNFSCMDIDFGKCFINTPDSTYKKNIAFRNLDKVAVLLDLNFSNLPELFVDYKKESKVEPGKHMKISFFFRPKQVKEYEFKLQFWVNSLCEEILTIRGEGIPLLFDLYEGCQKSFDLGHVKVGEKIVRTIEVMNHSKMPIEASYIFKDMYSTEGETVQSDTTSVCLSPTTAQRNETGPSRVVMLQKYKDDKIQAQIAMDIENALSSLKVVPNKCTIKPYRKVPLKIQFKPVGMISNLNVQLNMKVFQFERPIVRLSGCATGRSLCFSQNSLQFGRVRKRGCKILKVMLLNKGNFGARFWWQPLKSNEFTISPQQGTIAAQTNVTFTITYRPTNHNPFVKVWASCNIENYMPLELALYATCVDIGSVQNKSVYLECPVREVKTEYVTVTNPTDDLWLILSEVSGGPFDTLREFNIEPNSTFDIPVNFRPKTIGKHECQLLYSPLGESVLFVSVIGVAQQPNPNGTIHIRVAAKDSHTEELYVHNITENPETYKVVTEVIKVVPDKFEGFYEIGFPVTIKTWGEATATCRWTYVCYEECEMQLQVTFINEVSREYQFYIIMVSVTASQIVDTLTFESRARESVQKELIIKNPLSTDSDFYIKCDQLQCPDVLRINRNSKDVLTMTYSPLVVGEYEDILEVINHLAGTYLYRVILKCLPAKEKTLEFSTSFGLSMPIRLRVQNKADVKTDFVCQVSHTSILAESQYTLGALEKGKFLIWFEPTEVGLQHCRVSFKSPIAGEFVFNIHGKGLRPKPQGPFHIKAGGFIYITFKNVFDDAVKFQINLDRYEFYVKTPYEHIMSKKDVKIAVYLIEEPDHGWTEMPTGTLTIQNFDPATPKVSWTYFLQGE